jgi:cardiolipin synthase A/B
MPHYQEGHALQLLEGTREFFPALTADIDAAQREVRIETYIFDVSADGVQVAQALERAARRGVNTMLMLDGVGTGALPSEWAQRFDAAGVHWRVYARLGRWGYLAPRSWRRLHRKLAAIDESIAYCGGINVLDDYYDPNHGVLEEPRFDFSVRVTGPLVSAITDAMGQLWWRGQAFQLARERAFRAAMKAVQESSHRFFRHSGAADLELAHTRGAASVMTAALVLRDNVQHRGSIERAYRAAIRMARQEVIIANAYFVPGRKLRRTLIQAARRGVRVRLLLQGRYEYFMQYHTTRPVYGALLAAGVEIHEYAPSFLHAKVAVVDAGAPHAWATVGSSNLDPLSMLLAREANVMVRDPVFASQLRARLQRAMTEEGQLVDPAAYANRPLVQRLTNWLAYGLMRFALFVTGKTY